MSNPSKKKGTAAETRVVKYLREHGIDCERRALHGNEDLGDILIPAKHPSPWSCILEVKAGKQTQGYSRKLKDEWLRQTFAEFTAVDNAKIDFSYLVIAVHGRSVSDYEVWSVRGHTFYYLDDWCQMWLSKYQDELDCHNNIL